MWQVEEMMLAGYVWPVVDCRLKYVKPLRYSQRVIIEARLSEYEERLRIEYSIIDQETDEVHTKGHTVQFAVDAVTGEPQFVSPDVLLEKIRNHRP
jgi:acyl-CoA thioester hydrolase